MALNQAALQARYCPPPAFSLENGKRESAAQAAGRRYEDRALPFLTQWAKGHGYASREKPWIQYFSEDGRLMWAQPDFVAISERCNNLIIVETKLRHTRDAFPQLMRYKALLAELHPGHVISCIELCKIFDMVEHKTTLLPEVRPHALPHAAVLFDPREWTPQIN